MIQSVKMFRPLLGFILCLLLALPALAGDTLTAITLDVVNVRSGPSTNTTIIGRLFPDDSVTVTGRDSTNNNWYQIEWDDGQGWVASAYVNLSGDPAALDVIGDTSGETFVGNTGVVATSSGTANVRVGPDSSYRILGRTSAGESFDVQGYTYLDDNLACRANRIFDWSSDEQTDRVWLLIDYRGVDAWVNYSVVSVSGALCDLDVVGTGDAESPITMSDAEADAIDERINGVYVVTTDNANLRETNYSQSEVLTIVPYSVRLLVEGQNNSGNRLKVTYQDVTGWISISVIDVVQGNLEDVAIVQE